MRKRRKFWFLEVLVAYSIIFLFDYMYETNVFEKSFFNFYWIPLLFFSVRYDLVVHIFSVLAYAFSIILSLMLKDQGFVFPERFALANSIIVGVSTVLGLINERRVREIERLSLDLKNRENDVIELNKSIQNLRKMLNSLELKVFYEEAGISSLLVKLRELPTDDFAEFSQKFVETVSEFFNLKKVFIYEYKEGFLRFVAGTGKPDLGFSLKKGESIVIENALENGSCRIIDVIESVSSRNEPWIAVRIGTTEEMLGVITVEETETLELEAVEEYLVSLANWIYLVMRKLDFHKYDKYRLNDGTFPPEFYENEKRKFKNLEVQYGIPFTEICLILSKRSLSKILSLLRKSDLVVKISEKEDDVSLRILLPLCDEIGLGIVKKRLEGEVDEIEFVSCESH
ncbi:GAF domain-containing protein [Thermotoga sp. SG1]|uniref:GAF domain-containing protein n=1 Tax=Thermotoga sp. SG1 TaxID=126739 RepID=UPI000C784E3B|nr:GAF domain-containing protein [Thermotoga sp. SG1]PLV55727.1 histidine kinase [Thermotoga sp. SG1]